MNREISFPREIRASGRMPLSVQPLEAPGGPGSESLGSQATAGASPSDDEH